MITQRSPGGPGGHRRQPHRPQPPTQPHLGSDQLQQSALAMGSDAVTDSEFVWVSTRPFPYLQDGYLEGTGLICTDTALDLNNLRVCKG